MESDLIHLRFECLKLAAETSELDCFILKNANEFFKFVTNKTDETNFNAN